MHRAASAQPDDREVRRYVAAYFMSLDDLAQSCGASVAETEQLIAAGCAPGRIYAFDRAHGWWSALGGYRSGHAGAPPVGHDDHYSPAAAWWLRRAVLGRRQGTSIDASAALNRDIFGRDFGAALAATPEAPVAFPHCFDIAGAIDREAALTQASDEWDAWLDGGYAVCLRIFTGETCVRKESLGAALKRHVAAAEASPLSSDQVIGMCERLAQLMLPFSPWERAHCTPGVTIDRLLDALSLGRELPYHAPSG
ncbi:MAG: DUF6058 family natural product biosynthesis protein [Pseudomonadota bacterium]|nr:DUF6058 family natural product biosynthesis protein [Pseudomonadota bacterium]